MLFALSLFTPRLQSQSFDFLLFIFQAGAKPAKVAKVEVSDAEIEDKAKKNQVSTITSTAVSYECV